MLRNISATLSAMFHHFGPAPAPERYQAACFFSNAVSSKSSCSRIFGHQVFMLGQHFCRHVNSEMLKCFVQAIREFEWKQQPCFESFSKKVKDTQVSLPAVHPLIGFAPRANDFPELSKSSSVECFCRKNGLFANATSLMQIGPSHAGLGAYMVCLQVHCRA